jgi:hypothetical protein
VSTRDTDRDRAVDELVRRSLRNGAAASRPELCLDAETLAAWVDGKLKAAEIAAAEAHVSECARCEAMLAALVRATPAAEPHLPWWRRGWVVGSLVPLTAGAIAIAIWIAAPDEARRATADRFEVQAPAPQTVQEQPAQPPPSVEPRPSQDLADRARASQKETRPATPAREREAKSEVDKMARRDQAAAAPAAPPPPAAAEALSAQVAEVRERAALSKQGFAAPDIASPDPSIRWRVGPSGSIQHTTNGGATWEALASGVSEDLTAGAAPSATTVWVVGRGGTVLLSTDGRRWQRVAFPERVDLVAVRADDALNATVTTADGRTVRTSDGGRTWSPLQEF